MMRKFASVNLATLILVTLLGATPATLEGGERSSRSADFRVVVHPESPIDSVSRKFVADTFLKKTTRWDDGTVIRPVDQTPASPARASFSDEVLRRPVTAVKSYWQLAIFSGRNIPPPELPSDTAVVQYVLQNEGAIGYVSSKADLGRARVVVVK